MPLNDQKGVLYHCVEKLNPGGIILVRDADAKLEDIRQIVDKSVSKLKMIHETSHTSKMLLIIRQ
jgi:hypothetical protein